MLTWELDLFTGGWFIGDFLPSVLKTKEFEVGIKHHKKGEHWPTHYQEKAKEINVLLSGKMRVNKWSEITPGTVFSFDPKELCSPEFLEDCVVVVVKVPSIPGDKKEVR